MQRLMMRTLMCVAILEALEDDESLEYYIDDVIATMLPVYNQVSKCINNKD
jgi:hypothetical protein